ILDQISAISDITVTTDSVGRATVKLGNAGGPTFVEANQAANVTFASGTDGTVSFALHTQQAVSTVTPNGGALAGVIDGAA
ncbi:FlgK family flagellar hook-associated protein, partial [Staphylococcus aureus]